MFSWAYHFSINNGSAFPQIIILASSAYSYYVRKEEYTVVVHVNGLSSTVRGCDGGFDNHSSSSFLNNPHKSYTSCVKAGMRSSNCTDGAQNSASTKAILFGQHLFDIPTMIAIANPVRRWTIYHQLWDSSNVVSIASAAT
ncbi:hypothetical protein E2P81_ATG09760 [Venturia nashicola]|uniref:Uncharacterized protein n=1 Tax=Venturia nashicola TaxID=86259 RepID=A0A4Z1NBW6_9PEZI|nr:hypothetical protein E6O75_ATG09975 [Venturia nashicola]TLD14770.1 hypothetical protein E2P81_ATG09760 [Venturia nashicola]